MTPKILICVGFLTLLLACKENKAKENVEIDSPQELRQEKKDIPDIADQGFTQGLVGGVWHQYLKLRMALTTADPEAAAEAASDMEAFFDKENPELLALANEIADTEELTSQRKLFAKFTELAGPLFENALGSGTIYKVYCPMAFNNQGASWYSDVADVKNPYFGDQMLRCGKVTDTITAK